MQAASGVQHSLDAVHRTIYLIACSVAIGMLIRLCVLFRSFPQLGRHLDYIRFPRLTIEPSFEALHSKSKVGSRACEIDFPNPLVKFMFLEATISDFQEPM